MTKSNTSTDKTPTETVRSTPAGQLMFGPYSRHFWNAQGQLIAEAGKFSAEWFKRRQTAAFSLLDTAAQISTLSLDNPPAAIRAMVDWQRGAMERVSEDATDCSRMISECNKSMISTEMEVVEEFERHSNALAENMATVTKGRHATPV
ncbi:hypothetical protein OS189_17975 [Sulfitobacter sp. F26169L]|uniref:hypothetical protein n=1 Tax=Sulfitobacter sp. F26169L TaxID=2996015 RepID=UPI00226100AF|nr:hypothetical protein [Sulfitobacter sp. F26169L]MCX7568234.1 hypothetical protein [Sulfitobacter sp. F26169L]